MVATIALTALSGERFLMGAGVWLLQAVLVAAPVALMYGRVPPIAMNAVALLLLLVQVVGAGIALWYGNEFRIGHIRGADIPAQDVLLINAGMVIPIVAGAVALWLYTIASLVVLVCHRRSTD